MKVQQTNELSNEYNNFYDKNQTEHDKEIDKLANDVAEIFDLDKNDSTVYLRLLKTGPITASALSKELGVDRSGMYRIMDRMINIGLVSTTLSAPKLCVPLSPNEALKMMIEKKKRLSVRSNAKKMRC